MEIKVKNVHAEKLNDNSFGYSVVATTYNDENSIERFINDIISQTLTPREIVIADGGSCDKTVDMLLQLSKNSKVPIKVLSGKRLNIAEGYNEAIKATTEDFIGITGIGNRYKKDYFERLAHRIREKKLDGAYSPIRGLDTTVFSGWYNKQLLNGEYGQRMKIASNHGALIKKSVFEALDYFYEKFVYAGEDTEFYLLVKHSGFNLELVQEADVRWETPENFKDFKRQTKVYAIAGLQINPSMQLNMILKCFIKLLVVALYFTAILILLVMPIKVYMKLIICIVTMFFIWIFHNKLKPLRLVQMWLQIFYTMTNLKYGREEYKVRR